MCVIISQIYECNYITTISVIRKHSCICGVKAHILCLLSWNRILFIKKRLTSEDVSLIYFRSEERRVGKSVDLGGRRIIKKKTKKLHR